MRGVYGAFLGGALSILPALLSASGAIAATLGEPPRWPVRLTVTSRKALDHPKRVALRTLLALPAPAGVRRNDARYAVRRIPTVVGRRLGLKEGAILWVTGWLQAAALRPTDGAWLLALSADRVDRRRCLIAELPDLEPLAVSSLSPAMLGYPEEFITRASILQPLTRDARQTIRNIVLLGQEPATVGTRVAPTRVTATGQLFFDDAALGGPKPGILGCTSPTLWELAPVTRIAIGPPPNS